MSLDKPEKSHFFSYLQGKSKEYSSKRLPFHDKKVDRLPTPPKHWLRSLDLRSKIRVVNDDVI